MYYSAGTYESFAHPEKPKDVDKKSAYIIGTGLAGLTAAFYLVRDGQMKGEHIHLLEKLELAGGSCDGRKDVTKGFYMRGGREMDNHFEVMWDMFSHYTGFVCKSNSFLKNFRFAARLRHEVRKSVHTIPVNSQKEEKSWISYLSSLSSSAP